MKINKKEIIVLGILVAVQLSFLVNLRFTLWPEMLSYPYLKNHGYYLYLDMIHPYPPVLTLILSILFKFFGYTVLIVKLFTWFLAISNTVLLYAISKAIFKKSVVMIPAIYAFFQPFLEGNMLWFDFAISTPLLFGFLFTLLWHKDRKRDLYLFVSGVFLSGAALTKQTGAIFLIALGLWLITSKVSLKQLILFCLSPLVLLVPLFLRLVQEGAVTGFLTWVLINPFTYWSKFPGYVQMNLTKAQWIIIAALLLPMLYLIIRISTNKLKSIFWLNVFFALAGLISIYPRFSYFHLQTGLPFISMLLSWSLITMPRKLKILTGIAVISIMFYYVYKPTFAFDWQKETRFDSGYDKELASKIISLTQENDPIFLLGIHSAIYPFSSRLPAKPWGDNFGWYYEILGVQQWVLSRWESTPPEHIFWQTPATGNWYDLGVYQPKMITNWIIQNYDQTSEIVTDIWHWEKKR